MARGRVMASTKGEVSAAESGQGRRLAYLAPWFGLGAAVLVGSVAHWLFDGHSDSDRQTLAVVSAGQALAGVALSWVAWDSGRPRGRHMQVFATAFTAVSCLWVVAATIFGPGQRPVWGAALGMVVFIAAHNIRRALRGQGGDDEQSGTLAEKIREAGRRVKNVKVDEDTGVVTARVVANRQQETIAQVQKDLPGQIEAMEGLPRGSVQVIEDRDDFGAGTLQVVPRRALEAPIPWTGPSAPGKSIALPIPVGHYVDMAPAKLWVPGDPVTSRNASHFKVMGMTGSGKSEAMKLVATDGLTRIDFVLWGSCHIKGLQTLGPLIDYMDWAVIDKNADVAGARTRARAMLATTRKLVSFNAEAMGRAGFKQWEQKVFTELGIPLTMVWIDEAAEVTEDSKAFTRLCMQARSAGVILVWSHPRAAHTAIDTDARAQLGTEWCFGVSSSGKSEDAAFGLPDAVLEAGADPAAWGNRKPGMSYLVAPGIEEERWATPLRTFLSFDEQLANVLAAHAGGARLPDEAVRALGEDYARREVFTATPSAQLPYPSVQASTMDDDEDDTEALEGIVPSEAPELQVDGRQPIETPDVNMPFGVPEQPRLSTLEARKVVQRHLAALVAEGHRSTRAADIHRMKPETTRSSEWVRQELYRLCDLPVEGEYALERSDEDEVGVFQILGLVGGLAGADMVPA